MTRRDYVLLSQALRDAIRAHPAEGRGIALAARAIAHSLAERNPRFDVQRFLTDSETI